MNLIIYTFGSPDTFRVVLEALAVLFDPTTSSFFASNDGLGAGSAALFAAILATLGLFSNYVQLNKVATHGPLLGLMLYAVLCIPKVDNVWISDLYTGRTVLVQNVPVGIASIGFALSSITKGMIEQLETQYTVPGNVAGSVDFTSSMSSGNGFLSPLKVMYQLRENMFNRIPVHLKSNVTSYMQYCLKQTAEDSAWPNKYHVDNLTASTDPLTYFLTPALINANYFAEFYNPVTGNSEIQTCGNLNSTLASNTNLGGIRHYLQDPNGFGKITTSFILLSEEASSDKCQNGTCVDDSNSLAQTNAKLSALIAGQNTNSRYMELRFMQDISQQLKGLTDMENMTVANMVSTMTYNLETSRMQEAIEGETFLHFMMTAMNALMYVFYALFPLAMVVMVTKGAQAFTYLGGYLLFGVWIYSWMPVAVTINFTTMASIIEQYTLMAVSHPLSISTNHTYLTLAMDAISTGSNLLAATPLITLAVVSGSIFAMTSVASSAAAPTGAAAAAARQQTPAYGNNTTIMGNSASKYDVPDHNAITFSSKHTSDQMGHTQYSVQKASQNALASATALTEQRTQQFATSIADFAGSNHTVTSTNSAGTTTTSTVQGSQVLRDIIADRSSLSSDQTNQLSSSQVEQFHTALGVGAKGLPAGFFASMSESDQEAWTQAYKDMQGLDLQGAIDSSVASTHSNGASIAKQDQNADATSYGKLVQGQEQLTQAQAYQEQQRQELQSIESSGENTTKSRADIFSELARSGGLSTQGGVSSFFNGLISNAANDAGLSDSETSALLKGVNAELRDQHNQNFPDDPSPGAYFESGLDAISALTSSQGSDLTSAQKAVLDESLDDLVQGSLGSDYSRISDFVGAGTSGVSAALTPSPGNPSSIVVSDDTHSAEQGKVKDDIEERRQGVRDQNKYNPQRLTDSRQNAQQLDAIAQQVSGISQTPLATSAVNQSLSDVSFNDSDTPHQRLQSLANTQSSLISQGGSYSDVYFGDAALDRTSAAMFDGKSFNELSPNEKRGVLAQAQLSAYDDITNRTNDYITNSGLSDDQKSALSKSFSGARDALRGLLDGGLNQETKGQQRGTIGGGEMFALTAMFGHGASFMNDAVSKIKSSETASNDLSNAKAQQQQKQSSEPGSFMTGNSIGLGQSQLRSLDERIDQITADFKDGNITAEQLPRAYAAAINEAANQPVRDGIEVGTDLDFSNAIQSSPNDSSAYFRESVGLLDATDFGTQGMGDWVLQDTNFISGLNRANEAIFDWVNDTPHQPGSDKPSPVTVALSEYLSDDAKHYTGQTLETMVTALGLPDEFRDAVQSFTSSLNPNSGADISDKITANSVSAYVQSIPDDNNRQDVINSLYGSLEQRYDIPESTPEPGAINTGVSPTQLHDAMQYVLSSEQATPNDVFNSYNAAVDKKSPGANKF